MCSIICDKNAYNNIDKRSVLQKKRGMADGDKSSPEFASIWNVFFCNSSPGLSCSCYVCEITLYLCEQVVAAAVVVVVEANT